jgi:energy-coupling factor transporter ATP-binding protein EcfA2
VGTTPTDRKTQHVNNRAATLNAVDGHDWDTAVRIATEEYDAMTPQQQAEITGPVDKPVARPKPARSIKYTRASDVRTETIDWLVDCWIPKASVTLLAGREGIGKSTIAVDWAAQATTGKLTGRAMNVGYVVTEDSRAHTVVPRLKAAGADLNRVMFLDASVPDDQDPELHYDAVLDLPGDFGILRSFIVEQHVGLVILDAAKSVMSAKLDGNSDIAIRQFLEPMHRTAQDTGCTFIGLAHFGKKESADTGRLILGSSAWSQVARSVVSVAADKDAGTVKVWNSKGNLAPRVRTFEAEVVSATVATDDGRDAEVGVIRWGAESDEDGSALLAPDAERDDKDDRTDAEMWLTDYLSGHGEHPKKDVLAAAKKDGLANRTVERAFSKLGGKSEGKGFPRVAHWSLPSLANLANKGGVALQRGGTGGTGADLHKHRGGTGGGTAVSPRPTRGGTGGSTAPEPARLTVVPDHNAPTDDVILAALSDEYAMSPDVIAGSVPGLTKADAPARLESLAADGLAIIDARGRYTRKDPA